MQQSKRANYQKGRLGEEIAKKYLEDRGFSLIETNFMIDQGEIDLIMSDGEVLVFVEVKYKTDDSLGLPEEMITKYKVNQIRRLAEMYLKMKREVSDRFHKYRIDAVCILGEEIRYYKNIDG